ncbi:inositol monophosphatase family protein [Pseudooceanicola nanhaiensis]|uniref:inositol monophosphatase family protein n=1 Tax=Pseudooceanicola nanhaiensis TaxID=375761 RepID=UPI001CD60459|nr:inositol monophosphatase [Pseudooceanicola nanhaiensis]MCA0918737.1 inositol monophosphatase [Pseudooceanicola nanhaiensis]
MSTIDDLTAEALVALVRDVAAEAILPRFRNLQASEIEAKTSPTDLVTVADREAEVLLTEGVRRILPGCAVVGEEAVEDDPSLVAQIAGAETCVILDPVDGTSNFARGLAVFGMILAVTHRGETVFGLLYDPVCDDWIMAHRGGGAWFVAGDTRKRLTTRAPRPLAQIEGLVPLSQAAPADRAASIAPFGVIRQVQSLRCSCHEYRLLAAGQTDFVTAVTIKPWDHAAGQLILAEAGGTSLFEDGTPYTPTRHTGRLISSSSVEVLSAIRDLGPFG